MAYCRSGKKPPDIPANPSGVYAKVGWAGFGDWLGTGTLSSHLREFRSFEKARAFVRGLGLPWICAHFPADRGPSAFIKPADPKC
jgi:hypothetical protein